MLIADLGFSLGLKVLLLVAEEKVFGQFVSASAGHSPRVLLGVFRPTQSA